MGIYWDAIVGALVVRQPYVELYKNGGSICRKTILLDYRTYMFKWIASLRNRHFLLTTTLILAAWMALLTSLTAHLFIVQQVLIKEPVPAQFNTTFNATGLDRQTDWKPIFDTVAATRLYGGNPTAWTNEEFAFRSFSLRDYSARAIDLTMTTQAYSAYLDCQDVASYSIDVFDRGVDPLKATLQLRGIDRGCPVALKFQVSEFQLVYLPATPQAACEADTGRSRLIFAAGVFSSNSRTLLSDMSFISCMPSYVVRDGDLTITTGLTSEPVIISFRASGPPSLARPKYWNLIKQGIFSVTAFDANAAWSTNAFGDLVLYLALQTNRQAYLASSTLRKAIESVFTPTYLTATAMHGFSDNPRPISTIGTVSQQTQRLFVVPWVAYSLVITMALLFLSTIWIWVDVRRRPSTLTEEPTGLFSAAGMLDGSNIGKLSAGICRNPDFSGELVKSARRRWKIDDAVCQLTSSENGRPVLRISDLVSRNRVEDRDFRSGSVGYRFLRQMNEEESYHDMFKEGLVAESPQV